jgi:hypothetical protein
MSTAKGQLVATASYENLIRMIKLLLSAIEVDEAWYIKQYPDVSEAIAQGKIKSASQHFVDNGYFEGRLPFPIEVDETWYQKEYPDVAESVRKGGGAIGSGPLSSGRIQGRASAVQCVNFFSKPVKGGARAGGRWS